jgi:hypothetical protein
MSVFSPKAKRSVRFHLKDGQTVEGVEDGKTEGSYIVLTPKLLTAKDPVDLSGTLEIPKANVLFLQVD